MRRSVTALMAASGHSKLLRRIVPIVLMLMLCPALVSAFTCPFVGKQPVPSLKKVAGSGSVPIILIHGWTAEGRIDGDADSGCAHWSSFLNNLLTAELEDTYSFYIFYHDTTKAIGFDGSANADELGSAIDSLNLTTDTQFGMIAHSRGGLVARAFLNRYRSGLYGERLFLLLTLGTPHHGAPAAVPDWGLSSLKDVRVDGKEDCLINNLYNLTTDVVQICSPKVGPFRIPVKRRPIFNIGEIGALDLGWDNFDGPEHGIDYVSSFVIDAPGPIAVGATHTLSIVDSNTVQSVLPAGQVDNDLHPSAGSESAGSLSNLNEHELFGNKFVVYGGYFSDPSHSTITFENQSSAPLEYAGRLLGDFKSKDSDLQLFFANDGLVPIQSAIFLSKDTLSDPPYDVVTDQWNRTDGPNGGSHVASPIVLHHLKPRTVAREYRTLRDFNHEELRDGKNGNPGLTDILFRSIRTDIDNALALFPPVITNRVPAARFSITDESQAPVASCPSVPATAVGVALLIAPCGVLSATANPTTREAKITFTDASFDPDGLADITSRVWTVNTQTAPFSVGLTTFTWGFQSGGPYLVKLTITDSAGHVAESTASIDVSPAAQDQTWTKYGLDGMNVMALAVDPSTPGTLYAGTNGFGIFKSTTGGQSWEAINTGITQRSIFSLVIDPANSAVLYAGYACAQSALCGGVYKTTDAGATWHPVLDDSSDQGGIIWSLAIDPNAAGTLYAGSNVQALGGRIYRTTDAGATWTTVFTGTSVLALTVDPFNSAVVYAGTVGAFNEILKSTDHGASWNPVFNFGAATLALDRRHANTLYAGTSSGLFKTTDGGTSWQSLGLSSMSAVAVDPNNSEVVYAGTRLDGFYRSADAGNSWAAINDGLPNGLSGTIAIDAATRLVYYGTGNGVFALAGAPPAAQATDWTQQSPSSALLGRAGHAMAYDAAREQVVLFGGGGLLTPFSFRQFDDTWVWDGESWALTSSANRPSPRSGHAMLYDATRGQVVMFGGGDESGYLNDTWVWDGTNWIQKSPLTKPSPRSGHAMVYDVARGQVVMFGGSDQSGFLNNDTWVWDGTNWIQKSPANSPTPRFAHAMAYDAARGQTVMFGGVDSSYAGDTWVWDGTNWTQKSPANSPTPRFGPAMAYDAARGKVMLFGGNDGRSGGSLNDTWVWNGSDWTRQEPVHSPVGRTHHSMAYDAARGQVLLFGGLLNCLCGDYGSSYGRDTWVWAAVPIHYPTAGFTISVPFGASATDGQTLDVFSPPGLSVGIHFDAGRSVDSDGNISAWRWTVDSRVFNTVTFDAELGPGSHTVSLVVIDDDGLASPASTASVNVSHTPLPLPPLITGVLPSSFIASANSQYVLILGSGFQPNATVSVTSPEGGTANAPVSLVGLTSISVQAFFAELGTYSFTVTNPDGGRSLAFNVQVNAPPTSTGVLYDNSLVGTPYDITANAGAGYGLYSVFPFYGGTGPLFPATTSFTLPEPIAFLRIKRLSGVQCSQIANITLADQNGNALGVVGQGTSSGVFCNFPVSGTAAGQRFSALFICVNGQCSSSNGTLVLDGSPLNQGYAVDGTQTIAQQGGFAFQLCNSTGCSGGFGSAATPLCTPVFADDFARPDGSVGNGWSDMASNSFGNLVIKNGALSTPGPNGTAGIFRLADHSQPIGLSADFTYLNGFGGALYRYDTEFLLGSDGGGENGYGLVFHRGDQNYSDSLVGVLVNGVLVDQAPSTFQFTDLLSTTFTWSPDGSISGSVSGSGSTFSFTFPTRAVALPGGRVAVRVGFPDSRSAVLTHPIVDNFVISSCTP